MKTAPAMLGHQAIEEAPYLHIDVVTVDLNHEQLLRVVTGGLIKTRDKALKLSKRKTDPLPVHRCNNGERGSLFIVTDEFRDWASRQELI